MSQRTERQHRSSIVLPLVAAILLVALVGPARSDTEADLAAATNEVADLQAKAEAASQRVRQAQARSKEIAQNLADLQQQQTAQSQLVAVSQRALGRVARATYTAGGMDPALYLLLADDGEDFAAAVQALHRVSDAVATDLAANRVEQQRLAVLHQQIAMEQARAASAQAAAASAAQEVRIHLEQARAREAELERRYAQELAERRRQQAAAAAAALTAAHAAHPAAPSVPPTSGAAANGGQRNRAISFALAQVGGRYIFGADGPGAYDCSGLISAAYAAAGVYIPSYTHAQAALARPVPLSDAQPGDLLFYFGRGAAHVALYLGDGRMVHAVNPRQGITVDRVSGSWYRDRFTMAGRILP
jgi:cell wall-associated NlpC family hydrolase